VDGEHVLRFSPAYPINPPPFSSASEQMKRSQNYFYALNLAESSVQLSADQGLTYCTLGLDVAEAHGILKYAASTYIGKNDVIRDTLSIPGPRVVTFAPILKHGILPIPKLIEDVVGLCKDAFGSDVEVEFAINIPEDLSKKIKFFLLQIRPMVTGSEFSQVKMDDGNSASLVGSCNHATGNGSFEDICDLILVDKEKFDISNSKKIAAEIGQLNQILHDEGRRCILITFGRLGTSDHWLGVPVEWSQMSQAKVIIEADTDALEVDPSLGSHFHHNLISLKMGYMHIGKRNKNEFLDWEWLNEKPVHNRTAHVKHIRFSKPLVVKIDGRVGKGIIYKNDI